MAMCIVLEYLFLNVKLAVVVDHPMCARFWRCHLLAGVYTMQNTLWDRKPNSISRVTLVHQGGDLHSDPGM